MFNGKVFCAEHLSALAKDLMGNDYDVLRGYGFIYEGFYNGNRYSVSTPAGFQITNYNVYPALEVKLPKPADTETLVSVFLVEATSQIELIGKLN